MRTDCRWHLYFLLAAGLTAGTILRAEPASAQAGGGSVPQQEIRFSRLTVDDGLSHNSVYAILQDREGFMWFGTERGLNKYDGYGFIVYRYESDSPRSLSNDWVSVFLEDSEGRFWMGTDGGINRFDRATETFTRYQHDPGDPTSLSHNEVKAIYEDRLGGLWIGTSIGGLNRIDREAGYFTHYQHDRATANSLSQNSVWSIFEDPEQPSILWIGTAEGGLNRFDRRTQTFTRFTSKNSTIPHDVVYGVLGDERGTLWLSTLGGLAQFDLQTGTFHTYDADRGVQSRAFNPFAYHRSPKGELFFGGIHGFNAFFPGHIRKNQHPPHVVVTGFKLLDQTQRSAKTL